METNDTEGVSAGPAVAAAWLANCTEECSMCTMTLKVLQMYTVC